MNRKTIVSLLLLCLLSTGCGRKTYMDDENAVYYWRTEWRLDSVERSFLSNYHINKVYCRYFDVVMTDGQPMPNASIDFADTIPEGVSLVPTVYVMEDCMHQRHDGLAKKLVNRIVQMNATHDISGVKELQIDCDYTVRSRQMFYDFLDEVRSEARSHGFLLSVTIRLHQLSMPPPPADYGVLMLYNTGNPQRFAERNPVLDLRDVQPYLRRLSGYKLPLAAAYPVYEWQRTIYGVHITHRVEPDEILSVKAAVEKRRKELKHTILTFHLDKDNIKRYSPDTYEAIYHH